MNAYTILGRDGLAACTVWADDVAVSGAVAVFFFGDHMLAVALHGYRICPESPFAGEGRA